MTLDEKIVALEENIKTFRPEDEELVYLIEIIKELKQLIK
jgi:hypothetical protein